MHVLLAWYAKSVLDTLILQTLDEQLSSVHW
jgi:hypothetical protein